MKKFFSFLAFLFLISPVTAFAEPVDNMPHPWQLGFQPPATPVMTQLYNIHNNFLLGIITAISIIVLVLMIYICMKFRRKANPVPSKTTHNTRLEIIWTVAPIILLVIIAIPSLRLHYYMQQVVNPEMTLKVVGYQWYWHYEYPDHGGFGFDSYMKKQEDLQEGDHRLLAVDNRVVVPVDTTIRVLMTGADVIHAWAVPAFGVKKDAVPGRLNDSWFKAERTGIFYGQCSELCGVGHAYMPIVIEVVTKEEFAAWVQTKQKEAGVAPAAAGAEAQKSAVPLTEPVSGEHENPAPVMEQEKSMSKPGASDNRPANGSNAKHVGKDNQPKPAEAAQEAEPAKEEQ
jgi:cytochrome c oxidase subunit II